MTDDTGMLQHATFNIPRYDDGYCLDDNARALLLMTQLEEAGTEAPARRPRARVALPRLRRATRSTSDRAVPQLHDLFAPWLDEPGSDDSHGRALWALGAVVGRSADPGRRGLGARSSTRRSRRDAALTSPRAWAYALLGIDEYLRAFQGDSNVQSMRARARGQAARIASASRRAPDWPWFEDRLTYCNARLPQALLVSGARMGDDEMAAVASRSLDWLVRAAHAADGTSRRSARTASTCAAGRARFDQQPVEACAMVSACLDAHRVTGEARWLEQARRAFHWFLGQNQLQPPLYDAATGGCRDGLHADRLNENQGAESTLSFLLALVEMRAADRLAARLVPVATTAVGKLREGDAPAARVTDAE